MSGSITTYSTAKGVRYRVRYRKPNGAQTDKRGFTTKRDAKLFLATIEVDKAKGQYLDHTQGRQSVATFGARWLSGHLATLKPSSRRTMEAAWRVHVEPEWGARSVASIRPSEVSAWVGSLLAGDSDTGRKPLAAQTVRRAVFVLSMVLDQAVADGTILANPARGHRLPAKKRRPIVYLSHAQVELLATSSTEPDTIRFLAYTGLRWGEAAALQTRHVDLRKNRLKVDLNVVMIDGLPDLGTPKTGEARSVAIPPFLQLPLRRKMRGKSQTGFVFGTELVPMMRPHPTHSWFVRAVSAAMAADETFPRVTPHDLRHTAASLAVSAGANVKAVQRMLGHTSAAMTLDVYADLFDDDLDGVAVALGEARHTALSS
ncbi:MAG TPA: tyrosine-type recombinase/integrase [Rhodoglobus sp.]|jgi:integrase|nr:tyrosine-type recombinase/integrase [Rhodoglobus sp.]